MLSPLSGTSGNAERMDSAYYAMIIKSDTENAEYGKVVKYVDEDEGQGKSQNVIGPLEPPIYREVILITISLFMGYAALVCDQVWFPLIIPISYTPTENQ